ALPGAAPSTGVQKVLAYLTLFAGIAAAYYVLAKAGLQLASINPSISPVWPPAGLATAAVILWGRARALPPIFLGAYLAHIGIPGAFGASAMIAASNSLEAILIGTLIRRYSDGARTFASPLGIARFVLFALVSGTLLAATMGVAVLMGTSHASLMDASTLW